jgi:uncharacterized delta-60 repeat protein
MEGRALLNAGALDTSFGATGVVSTTLSSLGDRSYAVAVQPGSKVVVVGDTSVSSNPDRSRIGVVRYNADGSVDSSFGSGGEFIDYSLVPNGVFENARAVAIQSDGKIVVAGWVQLLFTTTKGKKTTSTSQEDWEVIRLNANGTPDTSFGNGGKVITSFGATSNNEAHALALQGDGKIVVAGQVTSSTTGSNVRVVRYNANGSLDSTFGSGGEVITAPIPGVSGSGDTWANAVAIDSAGRIVAAGLTAAPGAERMALIRYTQSGTLDSTFGNGGRVTLVPAGASYAEADSLGFQSSGKIVGGGAADYATSQMVIGRLNTDGSLDGTFGNGGLVISNQMAGANSLVIQGDDKIVAGGIGLINGTYDHNLWVTRLLADGSAADPTFGSGGAAEASFGAPVAPAVHLGAGGRGPLPSERPGHGERPAEVRHGAGRDRHATRLAADQGDQRLPD